MGGRLKAPKKQFVTEEGCDPEIHGEPWDPSKVEELEVLGEILGVCRQERGLRIRRGR